MFPFIMRVGWLNILIYYDLKGIAQSPREISFNGVWHRNISRSDIGSGFQSQQVFVCTFSVKTCMTTVFLFRTKFTSTKLCTFQILRLDVTVFIFQNLAEVLGLEFLISSDCDTWIFINRYESYMQLAQSGNGYRIGQNTHRRNIHKYVNLTSRWLIHQ